MNLRSLRGPALLGVVAAAFFACSSEEEERREAAAKAEAEAKEAFLADYCEIVSECCNRILSLPKDDPTCKQRIVRLDPQMVDDAQARTDCLAQLRRVTALSDFCTDFGNLDLPACPDGRRTELAARAADGKKPGDACAADVECAPSFDGVVACNGVCQVTKRGKDGDGPCVATVSGDVETRIEGEVSGAEAFVCFLRDELVCDPAEKKCIKPVEVGGACGDSGACVRTAFCDADAKKCATRKASGSACSEDVCQGGCVDGFCTAPVTEGGSCTSNSVCADGLACAGGKCTEPLANQRLGSVCVEK